MLLTFFDNLIFKSLYFLKWCPIFDTSPLTKFSKFNNFLWVCWFLGKNLSNFVPPVWKLHNPYCHNHQWSEFSSYNKLMTMGNESWIYEILNFFHEIWSMYLLVLICLKWIFIWQSKLTKKIQYYSLFS